ncbi:osmoprotectant transport system ATP-binding protein [Priestia aryabhattai B8W22]|nr:osmoprotectant transport system ATP-binding protein [Priestia aryabhattai B8W22]
MNDNLITFTNVSKQYPDGTTAVKNINLEIKEGEFFVLIGPSGCGKTTTLKMINRLHDITEGELYIKDKLVSDHNIHELRWNIGYVLQQIALFPHMTIAENIAIVPEMKHWKKNKIKTRIDELLTLVGLDPKQYRNRKPSELSGGQQQRVGVARALAADPPVILMDEPFSALDPLSREQLQQDVISLKEKIKKTFVFVTHDMSEAMTLGDRICLMKDGEIVQVGTPEEFIQKPKNEFVKTFIGNQGSALFETLDTFVKESEQPDVEPTEELASTATVQQAMDALYDHEAIAVKKGSKRIGVVTRKTLLAFLSDKTKEGGTL